MATIAFLEESGKMTVSHSDIDSGFHFTPYQIDQVKVIAPGDTIMVQSSPTSNRRFKIKITDTITIEGVAYVPASLTALRIKLNELFPDPDGGTGTPTTNASLLTSGTLNDNRLSSNVTRNDATQTLTNKTITAPLGLVKADVGLSNADNTSDANKPVSSAQQVALNLKADLVGGVVPANQLPAYVDDIEEYANLAAFPVTGLSNKEYYAQDSQITYRWTGSAYAPIGAGVALGETSSTAYRGDRGATAYNHTLLTTGNPHSVTKTEVGLGNVDNTSNATERAAAATLTNKIISGASNTLSNISADSTIDGSTNKVYTATEKTKLSGIATGATVNDTDANLRARSSHTGTQSADTLTGTLPAARIAGTIFDGNIVELVAGVPTWSPYANGKVNGGAANRLTYYAADGTHVDDLPDITPSKVLVSNANGLPVAANPTTTEINFIAGLTSPVQTQFNGKTPKTQLPLNVKDYGAVGDGVTNDGPAHQAMLDAAFTLGRECYSPAGEYFISVPSYNPLVAAPALTMKPGVVWYGDGERTHFIKNPAHLNGAILEYDRTANDTAALADRNYTIKHMKFTGLTGRGHEVPGVTDEDHGFFFANAVEKMNRVHVEGVIMENFNKECFAFWDAREITFLNNRAYNFNHDAYNPQSVSRLIMIGNYAEAGCFGCEYVSALEIDSEKTYALIKGNMFVDMYEYGIGVEGGSVIKIEGNFLIGHGTASVTGAATGIYIIPNIEPIDILQITGNTINNFAANGIGYHAGLTGYFVINELIIKNNIISKSFTNAIQINPFSTAKILRIEISLNTLFDWNIDDEGGFIYSAIGLYNVNGATISNNRIYHTNTIGNRNDPLYINNCSNIRFVGNDCTGPNSQFYTSLEVRRENTNTSILVSGNINLAGNSGITLNAAGRLVFENYDSLAVYDNDTLAGAGGLQPNEVYRTSTGVLMAKL